MFKFVAYQPEEKRLMQVFMPDFAAAEEFSKKLEAKGYKVPFAPRLANSSETQRAEDFAQLHADGKL